MSTQTKIQHKILKKHWNILRDLYKIYWPRHILSYYTLNNYIEWIKKNPNLDINIFTSDTDWRTHGTYVIVEYVGQQCNVLFNTLDATKNEKILRKSLENVLPTDVPLIFAAYVEGVRTILDVFSSNRQLIREEEEHFLLYYLPLKESLLLRAENNSGYDFKQLSHDDIPLIDSLWPHRYPGSDALIGNIISFNLTLGAYEEGTGKLQGWVLQEQLGTIGALYVKDSRKRQGLLEQLVIRMVLMLAKSGHDAIATVLATNRNMRKLFHKLDFKIIGRVASQNTMPKPTPKAENDEFDCN